MHETLLFSTIIIIVEKSSKTSRGGELYIYRGREGRGGVSHNFMVSVS